MTNNNQSYNVAAIRKLLLAAFTPEELRRFCLDHPALRPIVDRFGLGQGKDDMVDEVIEYCHTQVLLSELLDAVREANPGQYARFEEEIHRPEPIRPPEEGPGRSPVLAVPWYWIALGLLLVLVAALGVVQLRSWLATPTPTPTQSADTEITAPPTLESPTVSSAADVAPSPETPETPAPAKAPETPTSTSTPETPTPTNTPETPTPTSTLEPPLPSCPLVVAGVFSGLWQRHQDQLGCPLYPEPKGISDAEQAFERGHMFWREDNDLIYAVYEAGSRAGTYEWFPIWDGRDYVCPHSPPAGMFLPQRGFGWVWCTLLEDPITTIGWGLAGEAGFGPDNGEPLVQEFEQGFIFRDSDGTNIRMAYIFLADGTVRREYY